MGMIGRKWMGIAGVVASLAIVTGLVAVNAASASSHKKPKPKAHPTTTTTHKKNSSKGGSTSAGTTTAKELKTLATGVETEKTATFEATFSLSNNGQNETITVAQVPSKSQLLFKTTAASLIQNGTQTLVCTSSSTCITETAAEDPLAPLVSLFSPTVAHEYLSNAEAAIAAKEAGYSVSFSSGTYGGVASTCATVTGNGQTDKYCVAADSGVLVYVDANGAIIQLQSFSSTVPSGAFTPPAGATIITIPTG